jgi:hypothetical protein
MKIRSASQPAVVAVGGGVSRTLQPNEYQYDHQQRRYRLVVPAGYLFDGASIPRFFWTMLGLAPHGDMDGPALAHDIIYQYQGKLPSGVLFVWKPFVGWEACTETVSRATADQLLKALCVHFKVVVRLLGARAWMVWAGVRIGGGFAWQRDDSERKLAIIINNQESAPL